MPTENKIDVLIDTLYKRTGIRASVSDLDRLKYTVDKNGQVVDAFNGKLAETTEVMKSLGAESRRFNFSLMSIMFGGMQLQRIFSRITKSTTDAFTKIMESSGNFGSAIQQLGAHWEYLKFTIGSAINRVLEPLLPTITRIIGVVAEWVQTHPEVTVTTIIGALSAGTFLAAIGAIGLFLQGLASWAPSKALMSAAGAGGLFSSLTGLAGALSKGIGIGFVIKGVSETISASDIQGVFKGISDMMIGTGLFFPSKAGGVLALAGLGIQAMVREEDQDPTMVDRLQKGLIAAFATRGIAAAMGKSGNLITLTIGLLAGFGDKIFGSKEGEGAISKVLKKAAGYAAAGAGFLPAPALAVASSVATAAHTGISVNREADAQLAKTDELIGRMQNYSMSIQEVIDMNNAIKQGTFNLTEEVKMNAESWTQNLNATVGANQQLVVTDTSIADLNVTFIDLNKQLNESIGVVNGVASAAQNASAAIDSFNKALQGGGKKK